MSFNGKRISLPILPPIKDLASTSLTVAPSLAAVTAALIPAKPAPITVMSHLSEKVFKSNLQVS